MGFYDRDYYRAPLPRAGFGHFSALSVTTWLIVANVAVFLLDRFLRSAAPSPEPPAFDPFTSHEAYRRYIQYLLLLRMGPLERWGYFSTAKAIYSLQLWRFVTFQFLHANGGHLLVNMVGLFFFGPIVEAHFGARRYLAFYLLCGLAGAAAYLLLSAVHLLIASPDVPLVGASAGIFGLLVAAALIAPDVVIFDFMPVTIGMLALLGMAMAAWTVFSSGPNAGGQAAHLGGGVLGLVLMRKQHWLNVFVGGRAGAAMAARRRRRRVFQKDWSKDLNR